MKPKKIPMRMCVGCRESKPKRELIRVVRAPDGTVFHGIRAAKSPAEARMYADRKAA